MKLCRSLSLGLAIMAAGASAQASTVSVGVSGPGVQQTSMAGAITETFDSLALGSYTLINSSIGTYTASAPGGKIVAQDAYGGAYQTQYIAIGAQSTPTTTVTLALNGPATYFGFYFAAMDVLNTIDIYDGASLITSITRATIEPLLLGNGAYWGNPNNGQNTGEPYAYVNVTATSGTFDKIVFTNNGTGTGLETDNHSIVHAVPEPASLAMAGLGSLSLLGYGLRRRMAK